MVASKLANLSAHRPPSDLTAGIPAVSQAQAAEQLNVSRDSVQQARKIAKNGVPELQIAEITGKRHDNVMADIKNTLAEAGIVALTFQGNYTAANGKQNPCLHLPRRECDLVISGYSVKYRLAIIDRWQELEATGVSAPRRLRPQIFRYALERVHHRVLVAVAARLI